MKTSPPHAWFAPTLGTIAFLAGVGFGARVGGTTGAVLGGVLGGGIALYLLRGQRRKAARRREVLSRPFPPSWQDFLSSHYALYRRLPRPLRERFESDVSIFLTEQRITGIGIEASEELKLLVAASAVTLSVGWPDYEWSQLSEVLLYPDDFDRDYRFGEREMAGQAHPWGTIILSVPSLLRSFNVPDDGYHVGLHEFAHLLDVEGTHFDGIPPGLDSRRAEEWVALQKREIEQLREGRSVLDPYGAESPVEFLAVAVEAFFERPLDMRQSHRQLYRMLSSCFGIDPAAWNG